MKDANMDVKTIVGIIVAVGAVAGGIWKVLDLTSKTHAFLKKKHLRKPEKKILVMAEHNEGRIWVLETDQTGNFVKIGRNSLDDSGNPAVRQTYLEALQSLEKRRLVLKESENLYCLTGSGFEKAKKSRKSK